MGKILSIVVLLLIFILALPLVSATTEEILLGSRDNYDLSKAVSVVGSAKLEYIVTQVEEYRLYVINDDTIEGVLDLKTFVKKPLEDVSPYIHFISNALDNYQITVIDYNKNFARIEVKELPKLKGIVTVYVLPYTGQRTEIFLDAVYIGSETTNVFPIKDVPYGTHILTLQQKGFTEWSKTISVFGGVVVEATLRHSSVDDLGTVWVVVDQINTERYIDGNYKGAGLENIWIQRINPGSHEIKLKKQGFKDWTRTINVSPASTAYLIANLKVKPTIGSIFAKSDPTEAKVYLDGEYRGITPLTISNVPVGSHNILFTKDNHKDLSQVIVVSGETTETISVTLTLLTPPSPSPTPSPQPAVTPPIQGLKITSESDIHTKVKDHITSTEKLLLDLREIVSTGRKIGADVSEAEKKINSATLILREANASYAAAIQKTNEGDLAAALRSGNEAYTKGSSGMTMLEEAKAPLHSAIKKKLNDNLASAESLISSVKSIGLAGGAEEKLGMARDEIGKVDGAFNSGNLASAKEYIINADKLLGEIKTRVYSTFAGMTVFIGLLGVAAAKARTRITTRPKERKEDILKPAKVEVRRGVQLDPSLKALSISGLSKRYKNTSVLENVSFQLDQGKLCAIVGPSGGGKSTVVESLVGRITPDAGEIEILGKSVEMQRDEMNKLIGFVPQHPELYMDQSVWQNMMNSAIKWSVEDAEAKSEKILKMLGIYERKDVAAKNLSGGQLKRLSLGMELIREPPLLVLDEPTTGLDPTSRDQILSALSKVVYTDKKTAVFTTHFMDEAEHCDEVILVGNAKILAKGEPSELAKKMPGMGKIVQVTLEEVSQDMVSKISKIEGVKKVIREGRVLKIIMDSPEVVKISQKIEEFGGAIEESKIAKAGMKEVFVYYTGEYPEEAK